MLPGNPFHLFFFKLRCHCNSSSTKSQTSNHVLSHVKEILPRSWFQQNHIYSREPLAKELLPSNFKPPNSSRRAVSPPDAISPVAFIEPQLNACSVERVTGSLTKSDFLTAGWQEWVCCEADLSWRINKDQGVSSRGTANSTEPPFYCRGWPNTIKAKNTIWSLWMEKNISIH